MSWKMATIFVYILALISGVFGGNCCPRNGNLMKSIQYQLKMVEENDGKCDCTTSNGEKSGNVGFMVQPSKDFTNMKKGTTVVFDKMITNTGGGYNTSSGVFTAPSDGLYYFSWTVTCKHRGKFPTCLTVNEEGIAYNSCYAYGHNISASQSAVIQMKTNDRAAIVLIDIGTVMFGNTWSVFSGYKI